MAIDFAAHFHPKDAFPDIDRLRDINRLIDDRLRDEERLFNVYGGTDIDEVVLSQPYYMGRANASVVAEANDALLDVVLSRDDAYGLAAIPVAAGGIAAAEEFERCLDNGYNGGAIETMTKGIELSDEQLAPVFDVAEERGAPIFVHPKLHESLHPDALDDDYRLNAIFGREAALASSISKVIHSGVLDRHPDLDLVYHHLGGNLASMMGRVHLQLDDGRWPNQQSVKPYETFKAQLEERIFLDISGFFTYPGPLEAALDQFSASQLLLGTDFPFEPRTSDELSSFVETVQSVSSEDEAEQILEGNARELLVNL